MQIITPEIVGLAQRMADSSGMIIRQYFRQPIDIEDKVDASPVTIADRAVERTMRAQIKQAFPEHGIYGEEFGLENTEADYVWVLDPIDGTKSFISGKPLFGTLIGLVYRGDIVLGLIDQPILRERWLGGVNMPTMLNEQTTQVRECAELSQATLYSTSPDLFSGADYDAFMRLHAEVKLPMYGCDCYAYGLLALGYVDLVVEASLSPYDYCAPAAVVEQAGGIMTDWAGKPLNLKSDGRVIAAANRQIHTAALAVLNAA